MLPADNVPVLGEDNLQELDTVVVFKKAGNIPVRKYLHIHFQHCLVYVKSASNWRVIESTKECLIIKKLAGIDIQSIVEVNEQRGRVVLVGNRCCPKSHRLDKIQITNCVSATMRVLRLNKSKFIFTPFQLYLYLKYIVKMKPF